jgi:MoaA/NifB/PqqE/SkfB family radical SAM enzyme
MLIRIKKILSFLYNNFVSRNNPVSLVHFITNRCNARCSFCFIDFGNPETFKDELGLDEIDKLTRNLGNNLLNINITGGEPFARKDISQILDLYCKNTTIESIYITSNGSLPERALKTLTYITKKYKDIKINVQLSIDDIGERHDKIRKINNLFNSAIETFHSLKKINNVYPIVGITVSLENSSRVIEIYNILKNNYNINAFKAIAVRDEGVYKTPIKDKLKILEAYKQLSDLIIKDSNEKIITNYNYDKLKSKLHFHKDKLMYAYIKRNFLNPKYESRCYAGGLFGIIGSKGEIYACEILLEKKIGNLRDHNFDFIKLWKSEENKKVKNYIKKTNCNCTYECALAFNFLGNYRYQLGFFKSLFDY